MLSSTGGMVGYPVRSLTISVECALRRMMLIVPCIRFFTHIVVAAILFGFPIKGVEALFAII